jgi:hypothetical protein
MPEDPLEDPRHPQNQLIHLLVDDDLIPLNECEEALEGVSYPTGTIELQSLSATYEAGKELTFAEYDLDDPASNSYTVGQDVLVEFDFDGDGTYVTLFTGVIRSIRRGARNAASHVVYTVHGPHLQLAEVPILFTNVLGETFDMYEVEQYTQEWEEYYSITAWTTVTYYRRVKKTVRAAIAEVFAALGDRMVAHGLSSDYDVSGVDPEAVLEENVVGNSNILALLRRVAEHDPGCVPWWDDIEEKWKFLHPQDSDLLVADISTSCIEELNFEETVEEKYTAVRLMGKLTLSTRSVESSNELTPVWDNLLESTWDAVTGSREYDEGHASLPELNEYWAVRRQWIVEETLFPSDSDFKMYFKMLVGGYEVWVSVDADVSFPSEVSETNDVLNPFRYGRAASEQSEYAMVTASQPLAVKGNVFHPGDSVNPSVSEVKLVWRRSGVVSFSDEVRYPATGYEGNAYTLYGIEKERVIRTNLENVLLEKARAIHHSMCDVGCSGSIAVIGNPVIEIHNLQRRLRLTHPSKNSGMEAHAPVVTGYTYSFGRPVGSSNVILSTDAFRSTRNIL